MSSPSWALIRCSLIGSRSSAAGKLPALRISTISSTSRWSKLPVIWPLELIVLRITGADWSTSSSKIPSRLVRPLAGSGRLRLVSTPNLAAPRELSRKLTHGASEASSMSVLTRLRSPPVTLNRSRIISTSMPPSAAVRVTIEVSTGILAGSTRTQRAAGSP